ncbi:hypothetical protein HEK616_58910 [Streptomyces nigrescens]|uniref:Uncharacterized protein n=2 Tax=Streptomyces TaxID=1883 RepID=A0ABM8A1B1_STRNI|nr:hypothetical protein HEK616_58910 [Streptomyces nigrescens]
MRTASAAPGRPGPAGGTGRAVVAVSGDSVEDMGSMLRDDHTPDRVFAVTHRIAPSRPLSYARRQGGGRPGCFPARHQPTQRAREAAPRKAAIMRVDPTDPDTFVDDSDTAEFDVEAPEADAQEQYADLAQERDEALNGIDPDAANEADVAEQARVVELNEDEYR